MAGSAGKAVALSAAALAVLALSSCSPAGPTELDTPDVRWEPAPPSGGLEDDPYARAAREAILGFVLATNANDFTIAQLTESTTQSRIEEIYESHRAEFEDAEDRIVWAGPLPRSVLAVEEHGDGAGADVVMCDVSSQWYVSADHPEPTVEGVQALPVRLVIVEDGGRLKLDEIRGGSGTCDGEDVALGTFDPIPEVSEGAIRAPLD